MPSPGTEPSIQTCALTRTELATLHFVGLRPINCATLVRDVLILNKNVLKGLWSLLCLKILSRSRCITYRRKLTWSAQLSSRHRICAQEGLAFLHHPETHEQYSQCPGPETPFQSHFYEYWTVIIKACPSTLRLEDLATSVYTPALRSQKSTRRIGSGCEPVSRASAGTCAE